MKTTVFRDTPTQYYHGYNYIKELENKKSWRLFKKKRENTTALDIFIIGSLLTLLLFFIL